MRWNIDKLVGLLLWCRFIPVATSWNTTNIKPPSRAWENQWKMISSQQNHFVLPQYLMESLQRYLRTHSAIKLEENATYWKKSVSRYDSKKQHEVTKTREKLCSSGIQVFFGVYKIDSFCRTLELLFRVRNVCVSNVFYFTCQWISFSIFFACLYLRPHIYLFTYIFWSYIQYVNTYNKI